MGLCVGKALWITHVGTRLCDSGFRNKGEASLEYPSNAGRALSTKALVGLELIF